MHLITIHKRIIKESARDGKSWVKEIKQWLPKKPGSQVYELKSRRAEPNRHELRRQYFKLLHKQEVKAHKAYQALERKVRPTAHQMPAPARLYRREPASNSPARKPILGVDEFTVRLSPEGQARLVEILEGPPKPLTPTALRAKESHARLFGNPTQANA